MLVKGAIGSSFLNPINPLTLSETHMRHSFRWWLFALNHYPNQCGISANWTIRNNIQLNLNPNWSTFLQEIFRLKMSPAIWRPFCIGRYLWMRSISTQIITLPHIKYSYWVSSMQWSFGIDGTKSQWSICVGDFICRIFHKQDLAFGVFATICFYCV